MLRTLINSVAQTVPGVTSEGIVYPAQLDFNNLLSYVSSERTGVTAGKNQLTAYVRRCPKSKIVVTGVSQGADVAGSTICGGGGLLNLTPSTPGVSADVASHVVAIVLFGDPRFRKGMSFNKGNAKKQGIIPHTTSQSCRAFASRIVSYCDTGDPFCDSGNNMGAHMGVVTQHYSEAKDFIIKKINTLSIPVRPDA